MKTKCIRYVPLQNTHRSNGAVELSADPSVASSFGEHCFHSTTNRHSTVTEDFLNFTHRSYLPPSQPLKCNILFLLKTCQPFKAHANGRNKSQQCCVLLAVRLHGPKSLTGFKLYATSANKCQHCCGSMQNGRNMLGPTMLRVVGQ